MNSYHPGKVMVVIGGQYGSEGKGTIVAKIAEEYGIHVRVGSHNAGHSFKYRMPDGNERTWVCQQIPVGWVNPKALLFIGRGALISPETLNREIQAIAAVDPGIHARLLIDMDAGVLEERHHAEEGGVEGEVHRRIGSTGEGVGAARIARMRRQPGEFRRFAEFVKQEPAYSHLGQYAVRNTPWHLRNAMRRGTNILLEGSQGVGLSLVHGPWPYVTTTDCGAAQLCADVGIAPHWVTDVLCVLRTYPIRVAGNSGPLRGEITWASLSEALGRVVSEQTTVTHKTRRIGRWDPVLLENALTLNAPTSLALNFVDYLDDANTGVTEYRALTPATRLFIEMIEKQAEAPVEFVGTGGPSWSVIDRRV